MNNRYFTDSMVANFDGKTKGIALSKKDVEKIRKGKTY